MTKKFSARIGITESTPSIQLESIHEDLRNSIWNLIHNIYGSAKYNFWGYLAKFVAQYFRKTPVDEIPPFDNSCREWLKSYFYDLEWFEVYNFVEFLVENNNDILPYPQISSEKFQDSFNSIFERELSGYRFVEGVLAPISSPAETAEISGALEVSSRTGLQGAHEHLGQALKLLGKKPEPDYRNAIKEAISAVESVAKHLSNSDSQGLAGALAALEGKIELHRALKSGFIKLYGYSSDEDGIRHAMMEESHVGFDEAKYMIVACSAFVNFLIAKAEKGGLL